MWLVVGGLSVTAIAIAVVLAINASRTPKVAQIPPSPEKGVTQQNSGYTFTRSNKGHPVFTVHAARTVSYQSGNSTTLEDVRVETYGRKGDTGDLLSTDRCQYNPVTGDFLAAGPVQIELSANSSEIAGSGLRGKHPVNVATSNVSYQQKTQIADSDAPATFRMGAITGTAVGMTYDVSNGGLELKHQVSADLAQGTKNSSEARIHLNASRLQYDKEKGSIALDGPVEVVQGGERGVAEHAVVQLGADAKLSVVVLQGNVKGFETAPVKTLEVDADRVEGRFDGASGELRHISAKGNVRGNSKSSGGSDRFSAETADLDLAGKQAKPIQGVAHGNVQIEEESVPSSRPNAANGSNSQEKRALDASELHLSFRPDIHTLKTADTAGPGTLTIHPNSPQAGMKVIRAGHFVMNFDPHSRIETLDGTQSSKVFLFPASSSKAPPAPAQSLADQLNATFDPKTGNLNQMRQSGSFQYIDGNRKATADEAQYDPIQQTLVLVGHPAVFDPQSRITSQNMRMDLQTNTAIGEVNVKGYQQQAPLSGANAMAKPASPTNVLADKVVAVKASQSIHYEGHVRAWNGSDVVESAAMDVYRAENRVSTNSRVTTSFLQTFDGSPTPKGSSAQPAQPRPVTIQSDALEYLDTGRRARYSGHVRMVSDTMVMQSDKLDVYLTPAASSGGSQVDHAVADGKVKVAEPDRTETSDHAEYFAAAGKVVLTGGPPVLVDEARGSTTGQRLTFFIHDDRLLVDGGTQTPSVTQHRVAP